MLFVVFFINKKIAMYLMSKGTYKNKRGDKMSKRVKRLCTKCNTGISPSADHYFYYNNNLYCNNCIQYIGGKGAYAFFLDGKYIGNSKQDKNIIFVKCFKEEYETEGEDIVEEGIELDDE